MVCNIQFILEQFVLDISSIGIEKEKKKDTSWDDLLSSKTSCRNISNTCIMLCLVVIYQIHASCFISSRLGTLRVTGTVDIA